MFIRKKKYEDLLDKLDSVSRVKAMLERELEAMNERKKSHEPGPTCKGCKNLIENEYAHNTFYYCKLDRGCQDYTEE